MSFLSSTEIFCARFGIARFGNQTLFFAAVTPNRNKADAARPQGEMPRDVNAGVRKRGGGGGGAAAKSSMYEEDVVDGEEDKPLTGDATLPGEAADECGPPRHTTAAYAAGAGTVSVARVKLGMVIDRIREMDMRDMYRYWSVLQNFLADVPAKLGTSCPPLAGLGLARPPDLTDEQLEKLDRWCESHVGVPCSPEVCCSSALQACITHLHRMRQCACVDVSTPTLACTSALMFAAITHPCTRTHTH